MKILINIASCHKLARERNGINQQLTLWVKASILVKLENEEILSPSGQVYLRRRGAWFHRMVLQQQTSSLRSRKGCHFWLEVVLFSRPDKVPHVPSQTATIQNQFRIIFDVDYFVRI